MTDRTEADDRFGWAAGEGPIVSQCLFCRRKHEDGPGCDAFPGGIPPEITSNAFDHREPFAGDHGLGFDPDDADAARKAAEQIEAFRSRLPGAAALATYRHLGVDAGKVRRILLRRKDK